MDNIKLYDKVLTDYYENEEFIVIGIRVDELELQGDWSGGTHNVCQRSWYPRAKCRLVINSITANEKITSLIDEMSRDVIGGSIPTDKQINQLANLFFERDKNLESKLDLEMLAVTRGIVQGMMLMRQILTVDDGD